MRSLCIVFLALAIALISLSGGMIWAVWAEHNKTVPLPPRLMEQTQAQRCEHLYNVGRSDEWAECMGVGKK